MSCVLRVNSHYTQDQLNGCGAYSIQLHCTTRFLVISVFMHTLQHNNRVQKLQTFGQDAVPTNNKKRFSHKLKRDFSFSPSALWLAGLSVIALHSWQDHVAMTLKQRVLSQTFETAIAISSHNS